MMVTFFIFYCVIFFDCAAQQQQKIWRRNLFMFRTQRGALRIFLFNGEPRSLVDARDKGMASWSLALVCIVWLHQQLKINSGIDAKSLVWTELTVLAAFVCRSADES